MQSTIPHIIPSFTGKPLCFSSIYTSSLIFMNIKRKIAAIIFLIVLNVNVPRLSPALVCATNAVPHINAVSKSISVPLMFFIADFLLLYLTV